MFHWRRFSDRPAAWWRALSPFTSARGTTGADKSKEPEKKKNYPQQSSIKTFWLWSSISGRDRLQICTFVYMLSWVCGYVCLYLCLCIRVCVRMWVRCSPSTRDRARDREKWEQHLINVNNWKEGKAYQPKRQRPVEAYWCLLKKKKKKTKEGKIFEKTNIIDLNVTARTRISVHEFPASFCLMSTVCSGKKSLKRHWLPLVQAFLYYLGLWCIYGWSRPRRSRKSSKCRFLMLMSAGVHRS